MPMINKYVFVIFWMLTFPLRIAFGQSDLNAEQVDPDSFEKLTQNPDVQLVDVRTPEEYKKNHIKNALNIDINGENYHNHIALLDKTKPLLVYCISGGRSARAASMMRKEGFVKVFELKGGIIQWSAKNKPVEILDDKTGMSEEAFREKLDTEKLVLVDFYAKWCAPCKKMEPDLDALAEKFKGKVELLKINADENSFLIKNLEVEALPTVMLYKNGLKKWSHTGLIGKDELELQIQKNL